MATLAVLDPKPIYTLAGLEPPRGAVEVRREAGVAGFGAIDLIVGQDDQADVLVEVKIFSGEGDRQLERYWQAFPRARGHLYVTPRAFCSNALPEPWREIAWEDLFAEYVKSVSRLANGLAEEAAGHLAVELPYLDLDTRWRDVPPISSPRDPQQERTARRRGQFVALGHVRNELHKSVDDVQLKAVTSAGSVPLLTWGRTLDESRKVWLSAEVEPEGGGKATTVQDGITTRFMLGISHGLSTKDEHRLLKLYPWDMLREFAAAMDGITEGTRREGSGAMAKYPLFRAAAERAGVPRWCRYGYNNGDWVGYGVLRVDSGDISLRDLVGNLAVILTDMAQMRLA